MKKGRQDKCWYCGQEEKCTKDHFYPKSTGGRTIVYACRICQGAKGDLMPDKFIEYINQHDLISDEKKERVRIAVLSLMAQTYNEYLRIKTGHHSTKYGDLLMRE